MSGHMKHYKMFYYRLVSRTGEPYRRKARITWRIGFRLKAKAKVKATNYVI